MPEPIEELKSSVHNLQKLVTEFKQTNDKRIEALEKSRGTSDVTETLEKMDKGIDALMDRVDKIETARNAPEFTDEKAKSAKQEREAKSGMNLYLRKGRMTAEQKQAYLSCFPEAMQGLDEFKALVTDNDSLGGYFVRPELSSKITEKVFESSPIRHLADVETIGTDEFVENYDNDEPDAEWTGERSSRSETGSNEVNQVRIMVHEMTASPRASQKQLEDSFFDVEAWHARKVSEKFARKEATAFVTGSGVGQPKGIMSYTAGDGFNKLEQVNSGTSAQFTSDGLISLQDALFEEFQKNAVWLMARASRSAIRKLKDANGNYLWSVEGGLNDKVQMLLLGKPVHLAADVAAMGANSLSAAYGDFKRGYLIVDRVGISVLRDPYSAKPYVVFYTRKRVGGGVRHFQAIKIQKLAA